MVDSRLRVDPPTIFHCYVVVENPSTSGKENDKLVNKIFPEELEDGQDVSHQVPRFCYPCETDSPGVQYFAFVLTDIDGKFRYGFCRYPPHAPYCSCILSYLPWFETFYAVLDTIASIEKTNATNQDMTSEDHPPVLDSLH
jgi:hypothetical protein